MTLFNQGWNPGAQVPSASPAFATPTASNSNSHGLQDLTVSFNPEALSFTFLSSGEIPGNRQQSSVDINLSAVGGQVPRSRIEVIDEAEDTEQVEDSAEENNGDQDDDDEEGGIALQ